MFPTAGSSNCRTDWANWHNLESAGADSSVMMIGGGGQACGQSDHGVGITEENEASFTVTGAEEGQFEADFADNGFSATVSDYVLNLYVR